MDSPMCLVISSGNQNNARLKYETNGVVVAEITNDLGFCKVNCLVKRNLCGSS